MGVIGFKIDYYIHSPISAILSLIINNFCNWNMGQIFSDREPLSESNTMLLSILGRRAHYEAILGELEFWQNIKFSDVLLEGEFNVIPLQKCHAKMFRIMNVTKAYICTEQAYFAVCAVSWKFRLPRLKKWLRNLVSPSIKQMLDLTRPSLCPMLF